MEFSSERVPSGPGRAPDQVLSRPVGHLLPAADRDPQVRALARAASQHAEAYVTATLDPQLTELRQFVAGQRGSGRVTDEALDRVRQLQELVHTLPGTMAEQITAAKTIDDVRLSPPLDPQISRLMSTYPWMSPKLVRLRHALSEQALMDNVARPAAQQIGLG